MTQHYRTHLYTYATMLTQGERIPPENLSAMRRKAQHFGHTEGECLCVERNPLHYIRTGNFA